MLKKLAEKTHQQKVAKEKAEVLLCAQQSFESKFGNHHIAKSTARKSDWPPWWTVYIKTTDGLELCSEQTADMFNPEPPSPNQFKYWQLKGGLFGLNWSRRFTSLEELGEMLDCFKGYGRGSTRDHF